MGGPSGGMWPALLPLVVIGIALARGARARRLKIESLWIMPLVMLALIGLALSRQSTPSAIGMAADIAALGVGGALGWWRGRFTRITIDRESHALTSQTSTAGLVLIGGIFALRSALRVYAASHANQLHASLTEITDAFLLLAVGVVVAQRLEIWLRASRMLAEARAGRS